MWNYYIYYMYCVHIITQMDFTDIKPKILGFMFSHFIVVAMLWFSSAFAQFDTIDDTDSGWFSCQVKFRIATWDMTRCHLISLANTTDGDASPLRLRCTN